MTSILVNAFELGLPAWTWLNTYEDAIQVQTCRIMSGKRVDAVETIQFQDVRLSILANA